MKIVQAVGWFFPDRTGGTEVYVGALARRLQARGHEVTIVCPDPGGQTPRRYVHDGVEVHRYPTAASLTRDQAQGRDPIPGADWFHRWIATVRPDVAHFHTLVPGLALPEVLAARAVAARVIATTHASSLGHLCARGTLMLWGAAPCDGRVHPFRCAACELQHRGLPKPAACTVALVPPGVGERVRRLPGTFGTAIGMTAAIAFNLDRQRVLLEAVDRFVLLTAAGLEIVAGNGAPRAKLALNRLGVDRAPGTAGARVDRLTAAPVRVGYLGRYDRIKGVVEFARAIAALPRDVPLAFDLRGPTDTPESRAVRREVERLVGGDPRVTMGAALTPLDVPAHLESLDLICSPSACFEGGPTVALEAHAVGTPVIGTRIGGLAEIVNDGLTGRLVPPGDWRALRGVLEEVARDPAVIARWRAALSPVRTMDQVTEDYLELYAA